MEIFLKRFYALIIDYAIVYIPSYILGMFIKADVESKFLLWIKEYFIFILIFVIYEIYMEYKYKNTFGKKYTGIRVIYEKKSILNIFLRSFIKAISIKAFYGFFSALSGVVMILINPEISIHDYIVRSKVCEK